jgi:macrodomain Ter protein organizer (MatP/YcbG family)
MARKRTLSDTITPLIEEATYSALMAIGHRVTTFLKKNIAENHDGEGRLEDSFTYASLGRPLSQSSPYEGNYGNPVFGEIGAKAEENDIIRPVTQPFTLKVGTAVYYAKYVNDGSEPHSTSNDSAGFIERITKWGEDKGLSDDQIQGLIKHIRDNGTRAYFFMDGAVGVAKRETILLYSAWNQVAKNLKPIKVTISHTGEQHD